MARLLKLRSFPQAPSNYLLADDTTRKVLQGPQQQALPREAPLRLAEPKRMPVLSCRRMLAASPLRRDFLQSHIHSDSRCEDTKSAWSEPHEALTPAWTIFTLPVWGTQTVLCCDWHGWRSVNQTSMPCRYPLSLLLLRCPCPSICFSFPLNTFWQVEGQWPLVAFFSPSPP